MAILSRTEEGLTLEAKTTATLGEIKYLCLGGIDS